MKSLIFISAALMVGAGIFGFVDYKKKGQNKEFNALYKEEKPDVPPHTPEIVSSPAPVIAVKATSEETVVKSESTAGKKAKKGKYKRIRYTQFSRSIPKEALEELDSAEPAPPVKSE